MNMADDTHQSETAELVVPVRQLSPIYRCLPGVTPAFAADAAPPLRKQVTFTAPDKTDQLFNILGKLGPKQVFKGREVCTAWRDQLDAAPNSPLWCGLFLSSLNVSITDATPVISTLLGEALTAEENWREAYKLLHLASPDNWKELAGLAEGGDVTSAVYTWDTVERVLEWISRIAKLLISHAFEPALTFKRGFRTTAKATVKAIVYAGCTQKPPNNGSDNVYNWWSRSIAEVADAVIEKVKTRAPEHREMSMRSFDAYVKSMTTVVLLHLDRFYAQRLSLPTVAEVAAPHQARVRLALGLAVAAAQ